MTKESGGTRKTGSNGATRGTRRFDPTKPTAFAAFFLSGASSLIFQTIWSRHLHHVFGSTGFAISTVVTAFMAGLGLGAFIAGRHAHRVQKPLLAYAAVEGGVAVFALLVPWLFQTDGWLASVNGFLRNELGAHALGLSLGRFAVVFPLLLLPTTLMGASLPLLSRHFVAAKKDAREVGAWVGALYSVNTVGAVAGVLLGGFVLMPRIGLHATNLVAVGMNVLLCAGLFALHRALGPVPAEAEKATEAKAAQEAPGADEPAVPVPPAARRAALIAFGVSGAASLCFEVVWTRSLVMTIGTSVYSFSLILATFLTGIALGSAIAAATIARGRRPLVGVTALAILLCFLATSTRAVVDGALAWLVLPVCFSVPIVLIGLGAHLRMARSGAAATTPLVPLLLILAVPVIAALGSFGLADPRIRTLAGIVAAVTGSIAVITAVILGFRRFPVLQLALVQLGIGGATFVNYLLQDEIPCAFASMIASLPQVLGGPDGAMRLSDHVDLVQFLMFFAAALSTLPGTLGMGASFPLVLRIFSRGGEQAARDVGTVYGTNTLGSILGAWLPGFVLMPWIGSELTLLVGIGLNLLIAVVLLVMTMVGAPSGDLAEAAEGPRLPTWHTVTVYLLTPMIPVLGALLYLGTYRPDSPLRWNRTQMTLGVFRMSLANNEDICDPNPALQPVQEFYADGTTTTVTVERWVQHLALKNNGKVDASNGDDMPTQITCGIYPFMMHSRGPANLDVAVIGFGSGVTVGTALKWPIRSLDVFEIERQIPAAARLFVDVNHLEFPLAEFPYVQMERLRLYDDDGRNFLASTDRSYDVIISEPSNPWITGVSDLFTQDHFRISKRRLREGGVYLQWVQLYEMSPEIIKSAYRTFASQFRHVVVFAADDFSTDTLLVGSDAPLTLDLERIRRAYELPGIAEEAARAHIRSPYDVLSRVLLASRDEVLQYAQIEERRRNGRWVAYPDATPDPRRPCEGDCRRVPAPLNTDDNMLIEFAAPRDLIGYDRYEGYLQNIYAPDWPFGRLDGRLVGMGTGEEASRRYAELALALVAHGRRVEAAGLIERSGEIARTEDTLIAFEVFTFLVSAQNQPVVPIESPVPGPQLAAREARQLLEGFGEVRAAIDAGDWDAAHAAMTAISAPIRRHSGPSMRLLEGYILFKTADVNPSRYREAAELLEDLIATEPRYVERHPEIYYYLAHSYDKDMRFDRAVEMMRAYVTLQRAARAREGAAPTAAAGSATPTAAAPLAP